MQRSSLKADLLMVLTAAIWGSTFVAQQLGMDGVGPFTYTGARMLLGVALTFALLVGVYALFLALIQWLVPETTDLPLLGPVGGLDTLLSIGSFFLMLLASIFLMVPVASAFTGLFLEDVVDAVERLLADA